MGCLHYEHLVDNAFVKTFTHVTILFAYNHWPENTN